jgi:glycosyltransferase involved in cell wall biosynthesis
VFVLPSRREGLPVALLEAMACGLPCIASRLHGSTDAIIEDQVNGVLVPAGDVPAFASAIAELINDPQRRARLGSAARATIVAEYSSASIADRWLDVYHVIPGSAR